MRTVTARPVAAAAHVVDPALAPEVGEASRRIAGILRRERLGAVGLCPASDEVAVLPAAVQIGAALAEGTGTPVALLDINVRWSAMPPAAEAQGAGPLRTRWIAGDRLALLSLPPEASIGVGLMEMARLLRSGRSMFEQVLVDMTGLDRLGEHLAAAALCDALIFVARAGVTRERELLDLSKAFSAHRVLGVVLTGKKA